MCRKKLLSLCLLVLWTGAWNTVCRSQGDQCAKATTAASSLNCAFGVKPTTLRPLTLGLPYVSETDPAKKAYVTYLYPDSSNKMPAPHRAKGEAIAATLKPLNAQGNVDLANGKILAVAEGMSNMRDEMEAFAALLAKKTAELNPKFQFVSLAEGGCDLECWIDKGVGAVDRQVQILIWKQTNNRPQNADGSPRQPSSNFPSKDSKRFPAHALTTKALLKKRLLDLKKKYPNLKQVFFTSRSYGGWTCAPSADDYREPVAFEEGFSFKWLLEDQILGKDPQLAFEGDNAPAAWLAWGPYIWNPAWTQDMYRVDGAHPCEKGAAAIAQMWYDSLSTYTTARTWFRREVSTAVETSPAGGGLLGSSLRLFQNYPNPFNAQTGISFYLPAGANTTLTIYNIYGQAVRTLFQGRAGAGVFKVDWDGFDDHGHAVPSGTYLYKLSAPGFAETKRLMLVK
jgi:hypothetical protein